MVKTKTNTYRAFISLDLPIPTSTIMNLPRLLILDYCIYIVFSLVTFKSNISISRYLIVFSSMGNCSILSSIFLNILITFVLISMSDNYYTWNNCRSTTIVCFSSWIHFPGMHSQIFYTSYIKCDIYHITYDMYICVCICVCAHVYVISLPGLIFTIISIFHPDLFSV